MEPDEVMPEKWDRATREAAAGVAGAMLGGSLAGPEAALVGAVIPPYVLALMTYRERWSDRRNASAGRVLLTAADEMNASVEEVIARAESHPKKDLFTGQALAAGASTSYEEKITAIGRLLARGLEAEDDARLDEAATILGALAELEVPHVKVLATFADESHATYAASSSREGDPWAFTEYRWRALGIGELRKSFEQYGVSLHGVMSTLERAGLIGRVAVNLEKTIKAMQRDDDRSGFHALNAAKDATRARWRLTPFGYSVYRSIVGAALEDAEDEPLDV